LLCLIVGILPSLRRPALLLSSVLGQKTEPTPQNPHFLGLSAFPFYNNTIIFYNNAVNPALLYILDHPLKCRTVKAFTAETVIDIVAHNGDLMFLSPFFNHKPLIFYRPVGISVKNRQPDIAYSIFAARNSQFRMLSAFLCHDIHLPYTKRTMA
jgi:hypothetical protein